MTSATTPTVIQLRTVEATVEVAAPDDESTLVLGPFAECLPEDQPG
jgi:hypothetical protein